MLRSPGLDRALAALTRVLDADAVLTSPTALAQFHDPFSIPGRDKQGIWPSPRVL